MSLQRKKGEIQEKKPGLGGGPLGKVWGAVRTLGRDFVLTRVGEEKRGYNGRGGV